MSHLDNSFWLDEVPEVTVMDFESGGKKYVSLKAKVGGYPNDLSAHVAIVFSDSNQINEIIDNLEDARLFFTGGEDSEIHG